MKNKLLLEFPDEVLELMNGLKIGVYITDGEGTTLLANDESCRTGGLAREEVVGRNMQELERLGFVKESISLKALDSGQEEVMIQELGDGGQVFVSALPRYVDGEIDYIICTEQDITETVVLKDVLREQAEITEKYEKEIEYLKDRNIDMLGDIIAADQKSRRIVDQALRVAKLDTTVLLMGESGTGKEVYANLIYKNSKRVGKPFIKVNCAAIPETLLESELFGYNGGAFTGADKNGKIGYFELANGGTIFLDEIGELPFHLQPKLLRVLQEKEVIRVGGLTPVPLDVRLIVATNIELEGAVKQGKFRSDLYYRLNIMPLEIPPLRERPMDIEALVNSFIERFGKEYKIYKKITSSAIDALQKYHWPGNVRELQNVIERSMISFDGSSINQFQIERLLYSKVKDATGLNPFGDTTLEEMLDAYEKKILEESLNRYETASEAAKKLGMNKSTMCRRMKKYHLFP